MNKENNKSAAGLRRSAIAERIRLREEWSALKGTDSQDNVKQNKMVTNKQTCAKTNAVRMKNVTECSNRFRKPSSRSTPKTDDVLCGVVALVDVGSESRALPLRAALAALGASVLPAWSPLVTHLVWSQGGSRATRAKALALACRLVSPMWVEACAGASRRLPEHCFPAAARPSDLPSPRTLTRLLKKAEMENIPLVDLLSDSSEDQKMFRLRISSETEQDTDTSRDISRDTSKDTFRDTTKDTSRDTSKDISKDSSMEAESRVNTAPRRAHPMTLSTSPAPPPKSRRKLFTQREADVTTDSADEETNPMPKPRKPSYKPTVKTKKQTVPVEKREIDPVRKRQIGRKEMARAERLARRLVAGCTQATTASQNIQKDKFRIVLTGMSRAERKTTSEAIKSLKGVVQASVDKRTTHVVLGSFLPEQEYNKTIMTGVSQLSPEAALVPAKPRTISALEGAARGCRVLTAQWVRDSKACGRWLPHWPYEATHLRKIAQYARVERSALGKLHSEYAYDVFCGMRVRVSRAAANRAGAIRLLTLCGAIVQDEAVNDGLNPQPPPNIPDGPSQYYVTHHANVQFDVRVGAECGDVDSRWVFDSVAAGRMRTTRRYVVRRTDAEDELFAQLQSLGC